MHVSLTRVATSSTGTLLPASASLKTLTIRDRMTSAADVQVEETVDYEVTFAHLKESVSDFSK